jgi:threonyl-tRNA synthetase
VVGDKEMENNQVALRLRSGENPGAVDLSTFIERWKKEAESGE